MERGRGINLKREAVYECKYGTVINEKGEEVKPRKPIKVYHRFLSAEEHNRFFGWNPPVMTGGEITRVANNDNEGATRAMVTRLENCVVKILTKKEVIDDIEKFYETPGIPPALKLEIEGARADASAVIDTDPLG
jgi:hypothetical protein